MKKVVLQGHWGRVATRCAAIAERDEVSRREENIIMHKDYDDLPPECEERGTGPLGSRSDPLCGNC